MAGSVYTYDSSRVVIDFDGNRITGTMEGTFVEADRSADAVMIHVGEDGQVTRSINRDRSGTVTITLQQTSPGNEVLASYAKDDERDGSGVGTLTVTDLLGNTVISSPYAWVQKLPTAGYAKEVSGRQWVLACSELEMEFSESASV